MRAAKLGAALWVGCLQFFAAEAITAFGWRGVYSFRQNYISDLGAVNCEAVGDCSPWHGLMNGSFALQAALILVGAALTRPLFPRGRLTAIALALVAASSFGVFVVGLAPEDVSPSWHYLGAAENLLFCNAGAALMGAALLSRAPRVGAAGLIAGGGGLAGLACFAAGSYFGLGAGGMERVAAYPFVFWIAAMGGWLYSARRSPDPRGPIPGMAARGRTSPPRARGSISLIPPRENS